MMSIYTYWACLYNIIKWNAQKERTSVYIVYLRVNCVLSPQDAFKSVWKHNICTNILIHEYEFIYIYIACTYKAAWILFDQ